MVARGDIVWAELAAPIGRRPVCVVTRDAAIAVLSVITCAQITRTIRGIRSQVEIGPSEGLSETCAISCDNLVTIPKDALDKEPVGQLGLRTRIELDQALRYALGILY